jgi:lysophospholipase L1-like esterase
MMRKLFFFSLVLNLLGILGGYFLVQKMGGFSYLLKRVLNKEQFFATLWENKVSMFEVLPIDSNSIVMIGNSLTEGGEWSEILNNPNIKNRGIIGDMILGLEKRIPSILESKPKAIFLEIGINDLAFNNREAVITKYQLALYDILEKKDSSTNIIVTSFLPVNNNVKNTGLENSDILWLNEQLLKISASKGLIFLDIYGLLIDKDGNLHSDMTTDGIHLKGKAYKIWGQAVEKTLNQLN